jgi:hypothetical protein
MRIRGCAERQAWTTTSMLLGQRRRRLRPEQALHSSWISTISIDFLAAKACREDHDVFCTIKTKLRQENIF